MKVFIAKNKYDDADEHDYLIVAKTKKEAKQLFDEMKESS